MKFGDITPGMLLRSKNRVRFAISVTEDAYFIEGIHIKCILCPPYTGDIPGMLITLYGSRNEDVNDTEVLDLCNDIAQHGKLEP